MRRLFLAFAILLGGASPARAEPPKRAPQDYGGLAEDESPLYWVPRVLFFPLWVVTDLGIRRPLGALVRTAEKNHWAGYGRDDDAPPRKFWVYPSAFFDIGSRPTLGAFVFWNDAFVKRNEVRLHAATWGPTRIDAVLVDRFDLHRTKTVSLRAAYSKRQDLYFYGTGPSSPESAESRYEAQRLDVSAAFDVRGSRLGALRLATGVRRASFGTGGCCGDPAVVLDEPFTALYQRAQLVVDSRPNLALGSGLRGIAYGEPVFHPRPGGAASWVRYGGSVGASVDLTGHQRNLGLALQADLADPLTGDDVPIVEQPTLGGGQVPAGLLIETRMPGFRYGRLVGRSATIASLEYTWPIWVRLVGVLQVATGNVWGAGFRGFEPDLLRMSGSIGIRTVEDRDAHIEVQLGAGTETFRDGTALESFRFAIGTTNGF